MTGRARERVPASAAVAVALGVASILGAGCSEGLDRIDREVLALMAETSADMHTRTIPRVEDPERPTLSESGLDPTAETIPTANPAADALYFDRATEEDAEHVIDRLTGYTETPEEALTLDLEGALKYAIAHAREYRFAEEEYVLAALRLLIERHRWGPRFFNDVSATARGVGDGGTFDSALDLVNEFTVTQRLPYGGVVSAQALARATEDLHLRVAGEHVQDAEIILAADIPLLRGAGNVAREDLIQTSRSLIYAARAFERFRREFLFDIASDYLDIIVLQQQVENARRSVESFRNLEQQQAALGKAGRGTPFDTAEAKNDTLDAIDALNNSAERARLTIDRFKVRIGMSVEQPVRIETDQFDVPVPKSDLIGAVRAGLQYRLDLQTRRDRVDDSRRAVENARNALLGQLDLTASVLIPTDPDRDRAGLRFEPDDTSFSASITYGLPLDREIERLQLRQSQIDLARADRDFDRFQDEIALNVRAAVRGIDAALFSLQIQEDNVRIAAQREASIKADPDRADVRQKTDAIEQTVRARDARDGARRDLEVAVLGYLLATGQLRVRDDGLIEPLPGMNVGDEDDS